MKVYALVGVSGTGKSYKAVDFANRYKIECIVDDGLLIKDGKILAGISAKKEPTSIAAIRRAIFMDEAHASEVSSAIEELNPNSILILGTSVNMVERIANNLSLPSPYKITMIEEISTKEEMELAKEQRKDEGKHIIPVPALEVRKDFSGYFIDPLKIFRFYGKEKKIETSERTVVRPTFSYMGRFYISDLAIESLVAYNASRMRGVYRIANIDVVSRTEGIYIYFDAIMVYGVPIHTVLSELQKNIAKDIYWTTGLNILKINIVVKGIKFV